MNFFHNYPPEGSLDVQSSMYVPLYRIFDLASIEDLLEDLKEHAKPPSSQGVEVGRIQKITETANAILVDIYELLLNAAEMSIKNFNELKIQSRITPFAAIDQKAQALLDEMLPIVVQKIKALPRISEKFLFLDFFAGEKFSHDKLFKAVALPHVIELARLVMPTTELLVR